MTSIIESFSNIPPLSPATSYQLAQQSEPTYALPNLTRVQTRAFLAQLGNLYTGGDYWFIDSYGRIGKYLFSAVALSQTGITKSSIENNADLMKNFAWTGINGPTNLDNFLNNQQAQDRIALNQAKFNHGSLLANNSILESDSYGVQAGMLMVAHFLTFELTYYWRFGKSMPVDKKERFDMLSNGLDLSKIFRAGRYSVEVLPTIA